MPARNEHFQVKNSNYEHDVRESFSRQAFLTTMGAKMLLVAPGEVHIMVPFSVNLQQQHGFLHAGAVTSIADSACGYAAMTLLPAGYDVLSVEFKINLMKPAVGQAFVACGRVIRSGRLLSVCVADVFAEPRANQEPLASMQATMIAQAVQTPKDR